jgi:glutaminyl-peptide cyclotransferase
MRALAAALLLLAAPARADAPVEAAEIVQIYPHDIGAFTQGLFYLDGWLYESTGQIGASTLRKVDLESGAVQQSAVLPRPLFGEGIAPWRDTILSLTWRDGIGFRWSRDGFSRLGSFRYSGEGWALTAMGDALVMSDGTATLRIIDPATFKVRRKLRVTDGGKPIRDLNELEYVEGELLANVWLTDRIARINPANGHVVGWIDVSALRVRTGVADYNAVANGIAWDAARRRLFVTGKNWPYLFEIKLPGRR